MLSIGTIAAKVFGTSNDRRLKSYRPNVEAINALEPELERLSDAELRARTEAFRKQLADGAGLDELLVPAFATVREAAKRTLGQRHFDVQLIGGMVLHQGKISEMKTGEGKTLVATLPVYLNALAGKGVHVVTVNDYLAKRDSEWMGRIYKFLGLTVGVIVHELDDDQRREQYACDVTYGTNNELGFDYLRDNMKMRAPEMVQRGHHFAIVDEVDSILIDEARTPLIISGPVEDRAELYNAVDELMKGLVAEHDKVESEVKAEIEATNGKEKVKDLLKEQLKTRGLVDLDEKQRQASFTEAGNERLEQMLKEKDLLKGGSLYDIESVTVVHHANQAIKAHKLFQRDRDYIVKGGEVVIIDEFTGRMMQGRRYSEGLHQALEAKEHVAIQPENQTLASITFQNYFRLYKKLAGMTGTAATEANEFMDIYRLDVLEIPTNRPVDRTDEHDEVYRTAKEKARAIVAEIADCNRRGQPILVGTVSIEKSEILSGLLKDRKYIRELGQYLKKQADGLKPGKEDELKAQLDDVGDYLVELAKKNSGDPIPHQVLNARYHEQEATIIAQAGVPGTVTIATNMAGRGTDIQLGGNDRYRARDWLKEEIEAGRMGAVHDAGDSDEALRQWLDDILNAGDEWIDGRLKDWVDAKLADWTKEQTGKGREPSAKEIAKRRLAIEAERRPVAEKRAEIAREYAKGQQPGRANGHDDDQLQGWSDVALQDEARAWRDDHLDVMILATVDEFSKRRMAEVDADLKSHRESRQRRLEEELEAHSKNARVKLEQEIESRRKGAEEAAEQASTTHRRAAESSLAEELEAYARQRKDALAREIEAHHKQRRDELVRELVAYKERAKNELLAKRDAARKEFEAELTKKENAEREAEAKQLAATQAAAQEVAEAELAESHRIEREKAKVELAERQSGEREASKSELAEKQTAEREAADAQLVEKQSTERETVEADLGERQTTERDAAEAELAEKQTTEREAIEADLAEKHSSERETAETELAESQRAEREAHEERLGREPEHSASSIGASNVDIAKRQGIERKNARLELAKKQGVERKAAKAQLADKHRSERKAARATLGERQRTERKAAKTRLADTHRAERNLRKGELGKRQTAEREAARADLAKRQTAEREAARAELANRQTAEREAARADLAKRQTAEREAVNAKRAARQGAERETAIAAFANKLEADRRTAEASLGSELEAYDRRRQEEHARELEADRQRRQQELAHELQAYGKRRQEELARQLETDKKRHLDQFARELEAPAKRDGEELARELKARADRRRDELVQELEREGRRREEELAQERARYRENARREARQRLNGEVLGVVNETVFRFMSARVRAWADKEQAVGREPAAADVAAKRTAIVKRFGEIRAKCADIQADVAAKKQRSIDAGGLYVLGTERHESRRIDNQLRGRSGRQGDPGRSKFYLSLEDDLMRIFGSDRMDGVLQKLGLQEGEAITHPWINKALEKAQQKVEARNFDARKYVLKYDDVMNDQRKVIFEHRIDIMGRDDVSDAVSEMRQQVVQELVAECIPPNAYAEQWNTTELKDEIGRICGLDLPIDAWAAEEGIADQEITERLLKEIDDKAKAKEAEFGAETMRQIEKMVLLQTLDHLWREHLVTLEHLRQVIGFRSYGQRDPLNEYKSEGFHLFEAMLANLREAVTGQLMHIQGVPEEDEQLIPAELPPMQAHHIDPFTGEDELAMADAALAAGMRADGPAPERRAPVQTRRAAGALDPKDPSTWGKVSRNASCPCGSGKKYKHCHGKHD